MAVFIAALALLASACSSHEAELDACRARSLGLVSAAQYQGARADSLEMVARDTLQIGERSAVKIRQLQTALNDCVDQRTEVRP